jgi:hypothetical protein
MAPLSAAVLLLASFAAGEGPDTQRLSDAASLSQAAAGAQTRDQAKDGASAALDGNAVSDDAVADDGTRTIKKGAALGRPMDLTAARRDAPPAPGAEKENDGSKLGTGLMLGGAAVLGGLQGWFGAGLVGAAAGAGLGLAAAWLFHKKDYGGAFGVTAGAIIGTAVAGPLGGLVGAVVGGLLGHFLGKLFL